MDLFVIPGDGWLRSERASSKVPDTKSRLVRAKRERTFTWHGSRAHTGSRRRALGKMLLVIGLLVVSLSARGMVSTATSSLQPHAPIVINGNSDFNPSNGVTGGSGTASDPYMIQGWNISSSKNVTIVDDQLLWFAPWCGACVDNSSNVNISGSTFYGCDCTAVAVSNSDHVSLTGNNIASDTVLSVSRSSFVEISDNQMSWGID